MKALTASIKFTTSDHISIKEHADTVGLTLAEFVREACAEKIQRVEVQQCVKQALNEYLSKVEDSPSIIETAKKLGDINANVAELNNLTKSRLSKVDNAFIAFGNKLTQDNAANTKEITALKAEINVLKSMNKEIHTLLKTYINDK